jgi:hypothetical protein
MGRRKGRALLAEDTHEWVSFADPSEDRTWMVDVTFLASDWRCIFGEGCQGVLTGPTPALAQGCCSYGAHFTNEDDVARVEASAATLTAEQWQFRSKGRRRQGVVRTTKDGDTVSRLVQDACIFLNRPGWPGGPGCALHRAALERDIEPLELKPDVCWQLPLRREDSVAEDGHVTSTVTEWRRRNWGKGGADFHWWCTEAPEAFTGSSPVYRSMRAELVAMVGAKMYRMIEEYLDERFSRQISTPLPHPTVRSRATRSSLQRSGAQ